MSLVLTLGSRNLFQDRLRFVATLIGIVFSVVLVMVQMGLYLGFGSTDEIRGQRARVTAVTDGIRSFTTTPYVFAELSRARAYIGLPPTKFNHFIIRVRSGADVKSVQHDIQSNVPDVDALTPAEFRNRSRSFWLFGTGAGAALFAGALLGVIVGR